MSEMIERVARAICVANGEDPDKEYPVSLPGLVMSFGQWAKQWQLVQPLARAAIEAMREPTEAMCEFGGAVDCGHAWSRGKELVANPSSVWATMIDVALAEPAP